MTEIRGPELPAGLIPDHLTIPQFFLDEAHPLQPSGHSDIPWFIDDDTGRKIGPTEIRKRVTGLANELNSRLKIGPKDVACIFSPNHVDWPVVMWAVLKLGAVLAPANPSYTIDELVYQLTLAEASLLVTHSSSLQTAIEAARIVGLPQDRIIMIDSNSLPPSTPSNLVTLDELIAAGHVKPVNFPELRLRPGEAKSRLAFLCFSSGTTGKPKAVAVSHYAAIANVLQVRCAVGVPPRYVPGDVFLGVLPFFHVFGLLVIHFSVWMTNTIVVVPSFKFEGFLSSIQRYRVKHLFVVPPMIVLLCKDALTRKYDLSSVRWLTSGAASLSNELIQQLAAIMPQCTIGQGYGLTETFTSMSMTSSDSKLSTPGSAGFLNPGVVARVIKPDGTLVQRGEPGELVVTGPSMAMRYHKDTKATEETFINGWVRTGDEVMFNEKDELFILDRIKELIKVNGFQVAPAELEGHLLDHPDVADACVVGVPHEYHGEVPLAFIVLSTATQERLGQDPKSVPETKARLMQHVADAKVAYKRLAGGVEFIDEIPKSPSGKILRRVLRDRARSMKRSTPDTQLILSRL